MRARFLSFIQTVIRPAFERRALWRSCLAVSAAFALGLSNKADATDIWVVTDRAHPLVGSHGVRVIQIDAASQIEAELNAHLPNNEQEASAIARQRLSNGVADLSRRLTVAYQELTDAWSLGITKVPAVVVDHRYVVYGTLDIELAVSLIDHYRSVDP
jgi:integrating conjugative element protein (TIGR03757 family)